MRERDIWTPTVTTGVVKPFSTSVKKRVWDKSIDLVDREYGRRKEMKLRSLFVNFH